MITAGFRPAPALSRSAGTSASQSGRTRAASSSSAAAWWTVSAAAAYSAEACTQSTALRLSSAASPVAPAAVAVSIGAAGAAACGASAGVDLQPARQSVAASRETARIEWRMAGRPAAGKPPSLANSVDRQSWADCPVPARSAFQHRPDRGEADVGAFLPARCVGDRVGAVALQLRGGQFVEEAAGREPQLRAPALRFARVRQPQLLLGAGDADVEQAPLLVQAPFVEAGLVRQRAVLHADDEHVAELQPLGRVQAHQPHLVAGVVLVGVAEQSERGGKLARPGAAAGPVEPVGQFV